LPLQSLSHFYNIQIAGAQRHAETERKDESKTAMFANDLYGNQSSLPGKHAHSDTFKFSAKNG